jgi:hypothetical protein
MPPLDLAATHQALDDLPLGVADVLVSVFEADVVRLVHEMGQARRDRDNQGFHFAAHGLAGVAGTYGARHLEALARQSLRPAGLSESDPLPAIELASILARREIREVFSASSH